MASKHRKRSRTANRVARVGVATATIGALVVGTSPPAGANSTSPGLPAMAVAPGAPDPASIPDLTFGLGPQGYELFQALGAALESGVLDNLNLATLLQPLGYQPESVVVAALDTAITKALSGIPIDVSGVPVLGPILTGAGITNVAALLKLLGFGLAAAPTPGINLITAGPPFSLVKLLGVDVGWAPGLHDAVADEINGTPYLDIEALSVLEALNVFPPLSANGIALRTLIATVKALPGGDLNAVDLRVPVVVGFGLGAFAAGMAYPQVVEQLPQQPGGAQYTGDSPLLGSITILPMILLRNPGRANGGLFARFYPEAALLGIDTVTPDTEVSSSIDPNNPFNSPIGTTGIVLGGANLVPIKVDATVEYDPLSDVPAWPNPFSLANSAAALAFPTYILRGVTAESMTEVTAGQLTPQLAEALANTTGPLALNLYLTVPVNDALPLLEPVKLPIDAINLLTGANLNNPLATALEPALTSLVNLGYTDVQRNVVGGVPEYDRTLDQADVVTPFGTLPSGVDWGQVPGDLAVALRAGIQRSIAEGAVSDTPVVNPLGIIAKVAGLGGLPGAADAASPSSRTGLTDAAVNAAVGAMVPVAARPQEPAPSAAKVLPADDADDHTDTVPVTKVATAVPSKPAKPVRAATNAEASAKRAQARADASVKRAADRLDKIAKDGQRQIQKVIKDVQDNVRKTVKTGSAADKSADKPSDSG